MYLNFFNPVEFVAGLIYFFGQRIDRARRSPKAKYASYPTICVGNFQAGGTGKTPTTQWLASQLKQLGYSPIILTRGYKSRIQENNLVDSKDAAKFGDETLLHSEHYKTIVGKNRLKSAALAEKLPDKNKVLVLDDGLQHYEILKDFSIVCQKSHRFEADQLLPFGRLREIPHTNIDAIISHIDEIGQPLHTSWKGIPEFNFSRKTFLVSGTTDQGLVVCGVANPDDCTFRIQKAGGFIAEEKKFRDHHRYSAADLSRIEKASKKYDYRVHCTAKDAVKLARLIEEENSPIQLSVWDVEIQPVGDVQPLLDAMVAKIEEVYENRSQKQA